MGSPNGLWTAVSGAMAQSQNLDIVANNLANTNTVGFKKDTPTFKEYLTSIERPPPPDVDIPRTIFKDSDFYHFDGRENTKVTIDKTHTNHAQGNFKMTNNPFDLAIDGNAYFTLYAPSGLAFTRAGDFKVNAQGQLVTTDGHFVLALAGEAEALRSAAQAQTQQVVEGVAAQPQAAGQPTGGQPPLTVGQRSLASVNPFSSSSLIGGLTGATPPVQQPATPQPLLRVISVQESLVTGQKIYITAEGEMFSGETPIGTLALAEFSDPRRLEKVSSTLFKNKDSTNVPRIAMDSRVRQGFLETSNVNPVAELVELLKANRMFESNMRAIKSYSEMATKEANEVGKL